jgi:pyrroloquinoline quinone biosynthesis protein B
LFNASPTSGNRLPGARVQPATDARVRSTPLRAVVLTNADVDHITGLLSLRERQPLQSTRRLES